MIKPIHTLLSLLAVGALCSLTMLVFPKDGLKLGKHITLEFETWDSFLAADTLSDAPIENIVEFLDIYTVEVDSIAIQDSLLREEAIRRQAMMRLQYDVNNTQALNKFFKALYAVETDKSKSVRVLHYGDSQIEGDRITGYLRNELQKQYGGTGPGFVHITEVIPTLAIDQDASESWYRYTINGRKDTTVKHNRYGLLAHFNRFTPISTEWPEDTLVNAWLEYKPGRMTYSRSKKWTRARLMFGQVEKPFFIDASANGIQLSADSIGVDEPFSTLEWNFESTPTDLKLEVKGELSPEFYGISFDSPTGIHVDNIPLRGSSGTLFKKISKAQLQAQYNELEIGLIILQFGGNTVPYIQSVKEADRYGNWFKSQITYLKSMVPNASFMVIGPSDMATKDKDHFVTRPFLPEVRDALKRACFEKGCAFWDIYEVMGGRNSMQSWVNADPPLAGRDYTHFTPAGAKRIAELLNIAIQEDYTAWKEAK
jgi:lysophospholipase L1-like esterase